MITPMKYITVLCMKEDKEQVLSALQRCGEMMLCEPDESAPSAASARDAEEIEELIRVLKTYETKTSFLASPPEVELRTFEKICAEDEALVGELRELTAALAASEAELKAKTQLKEQLLPWRGLSCPVEELRESSYTVGIPGEFPLRHIAACAEAAREHSAALEIISQDNSKAYAVAFYIKEESAAALFAAGFEKVTLPIASGIVEERVTVLEQEISSLSRDADRIRTRLSELADSTAPKLLYEQYRAENQRQEAPAAETGMTAYLEGWVPADRLDAVEKAISGAADVYELSHRDPLPDELPPTVLRNNRTVSQFEGITGMFNSPKYGEIDPNPVMAPWYWLIFGLMMGDAGYGLMMAIGVLILKKLMKPRGDTEKLMNVILYSSVTTMICGVLFGSYFGETWHPILFNPLNDPVKMLILTLLVGGLHIFTGMITKAVMNIKAGHALAAVFDQFSWMLILSGVGLIFLSQTRIVGITLAAIGAVIVLLTAGRAKKGIFGKITGGLVGLYGVTNYMSDILSYSRILALSLATGVVGMVMNMLAGMVRGSIPVLGFVFALLIYAVGHVFNLALSLLSAYVHDCRLQYIEFYGKFFDGGGKIFKPFSIQTKYIRLKDDNGGKQ